MTPAERGAQLERLETATRQARDNAAKAAGMCEEIGATDLALDLNRLAAMYDALLAQVLREQADVPEDPEPDAV